MPTRRMFNLVFPNFIKWIKDAFVSRPLDVLYLVPLYPGISQGFKIRIDMASLTACQIKFGAVDLSPLQQKQWHGPLFIINCVALPVIKFSWTGLKHHRK